MCASYNHLWLCKVTKEREIVPSKKGGLGGGGTKLVWKSLSEKDIKLDDLMKLLLASLSMILPGASIHLPNEVILENILWLPVVALIQAKVSNLNSIM